MLLFFAIFVPMKLSEMKHIFTTLIIATFLCGCSTHKSYDYASLVNPLIGTDYKGNVYPGAQVPFGMVQLSPDNGLPGWDRIAGYFYPDSTIAGFLAGTALQETPGQCLVRAVAYGTAACLTERKTGCKIA